MALLPLPPPSSSLLPLPAQKLQLCAQCPLKNMEIVWQRMNEDRTERLHS